LPPAADAANPLPKRSNTVKGLLIAAAILAALFLGLLTLVMLGFSTGPVGMLVGIVLAVLPLPIYMLLALWIDRFEKEPVWMLAAAFLWGATAAVFFAFILNTAFAIAATGVIGEHADFATAVVAAPFVEELAKGLALIIFFIWKRDEFDNVLDGIIYAAMAGLGFAMTENIQYYGNALVTGGLGASIFTFILRGVVSPFAHPLFTSMTGIGLGLARQAPKGSARKFLAPLIGLALAMFLHFLWNFSASLGAMFFVSYALVMVPTFLGLIVMVILSLRHEGRIIREHLLPELRSGLLDEQGHRALGTVGGRLAEASSAFARGGLRQWRSRTRFQELASELAFHRWRTGRGIYPRSGSPAVREQEYLARLLAMRIALVGPMSTPPASALLPNAPGGSSPAASAISDRRTSAATPRAGGFSGAALALGSLGCLGAVVLAVIVIAVALYAIGSTVETTPAAGPLYRQPLTTLIPAKICGAVLENTEALDADSARMYGAVDALSGIYSKDATVLLLNYRTIDLAAAAVPQVVLAAFPEAAGWEARQKAQPQSAPRGELIQKGSGKAGIITTYGSLVLLLEGPASDIAQCEADLLQQIAQAPISPQ
jgi:RsiW-degrading membrane proteinase PrsW (M82 family)